MRKKMYYLVEVRGPKLLWGCVKLKYVGKNSLEDEEWASQSFKIHVVTKKKVKIPPEFANDEIKTIAEGRKLIEFLRAHSE
jgi:hypothetical protein